MKLLPITLALLITPALSNPFSKSYSIEDIKLPDGTPPEVGALDFDSQGNLYVCLRRSDVFRASPTKDPSAFQWKLFASGFHNGCGIVVLEPGKILISQMAELTSAHDTDNDGTADQYRNVADDWGLSGNYHETNDICSDGKGGYFLAIGTASYNGPTFEHTKGEYSKISRRGRNFAAVKNRGWILHLDSAGKITPWASGFRMHNGIHTDPDGNTWCSDNQGDWVATTPFYHIEKGNFYGHPSSLVWDKSWPADKDPLLTYRNDLDAYNKHRTQPTVMIPHSFCRSGAKPITIPKNGSFGKHFAGQYLLPDNNSKRICRIAIEKIDGTYQGMATHFIDGNNLRSGNNRLAFSPDGTDLYIGQTVRGWGAPAEGLQRISYLGETPFDISTINITPTGFRLNFTSPPQEIKPTDITISSSTYQSRWTYGSQPENQINHTVSNLKTENPNTISISLTDFQPGRLYEIKLPKIKTTQGTEIQNQTFYYTANKIPKS